MGLYWYLTGPIAAFDKVLVNTQSDFMPGAYTFRILTKFLEIIGVLGEKWVSPAVGSNTVLYFSPVPTNVYTWFRAFYDDFGLVGVTIEPYMIGLVSSWLYFSLLRHFSLAKVVLLSVLIGVIFFSIMGFTLQDIEQSIVVVLAYVIERILRIRSKSTSRYTSSRIVDLPIYET